METSAATTSGRTTAESRFLTTDGFSRPDGDFFALNGGAIAYGHSSAGTASDLFGNNPEIRIYERGGEITVDSNVRVDIDGVDFIAPRGNVLKSVSMSSELRDSKFRTPPSVEITDATGSNAAAIVNYDLDTKKVTNITVVCRGENYTAPTANLHFRRGETLLSTPLTCTVGPEESGDFTFSSTNNGGYVWIGNSTNYTYGTIIVDMDKGGFADGGKTTSMSSNSLILDYMENRDGKPKPRFPNLTKIVVKSGAICISSSWGYSHKTAVNFLPNCYMLEMYGGHISGGSLAVTNFTLGGTAWLTGHQLARGASSISYGQTSPYWCDLNITSETSGTEDVHVSWKTKDVPAQPGDMDVDVDATPNDEPSKLLGGTGRWHNTVDDYYYRSTIRFGGTPENPSRIHLKNYESLRKTKERRTLLDLSDENLDVFGPTNIVAVTPPEIKAYGNAKWSSVEKKLYWMPASGLFLIFK